MDALINPLIQDLTVERPLTPQVLDYITSHYSCPEEELPQFFATKVPELDDTELDLTFSPQFTPTDADRVRYIEFVKDGAISEAELTQLIDGIEDKGLFCTLITPQNEKVTLPLTSVIVQRYVARLSLDKPIPADLYAAILADAPAEARNPLNVQARDAIWHHEERREIFKAFLKAFKARNSFELDKAIYLTEFVHTYRPKTLGDMEAQLLSLKKSCEEDLERLPSRSFHDDHLKEQYEDSPIRRIDERIQVEAFYLRLLDMSKSLLEDYQSIQQPSGV